MILPHEKEHLLHKVAAASAFVCALCVLPVAQYLLTSGQASALVEQGAVAGVSTDSSITRQDVATPTPAITCAEVAAQEAGLDSWLASYKLGQQAMFDSLPAVKQERASAASASDIQPVLDAEYAPFAQRVSEASSSVDSQKKELASRSCLP